MRLPAGLRNVQAVLSKSTYSNGAVALAALQRRMSAAQHRVAAVEVRAASLIQSDAGAAPSQFHCLIAGKARCCGSTPDRALREAKPWVKAWH